MTTSTGIPSTYTTRWNPQTHQPSTLTPGSTTSSDTADLVHPRKYNTSCNSCRKSRVKCSGGVPCRRCVSSSNASSCVYSISQRRGKRKASGEPSYTPDVSRRVATGALNVGLHSALDFVAQNSQTENPEALLSGIDHNTLFQSNTFQVDPSLLPNNLTVFTSNSPSLTDLIDSLDTPPPPSSSSPSQGQRCPGLCYILIHDKANILSDIFNSPGQTSLDEILRLLQDVYQLATKYLSCPNCDAGCPRLMNLAMLHQRQVNLLCEIAKAPSVHLENDTTRVGLGIFHPSKQDDLSLKRLMLQNATRDVEMLVEKFHQGAREFEERYIAGTLELGDAGKLNLTWLLGVASNLERRLHCIKLLLEKEDWASELIRS
ncbi:uncharacterized protein NECHADRAFT_79498 [Fusarium vanettenii 77-13-4]|uniref:Zn(2)-C6 fungal-type domain-containing protein n=1 Tax=Fusarium vanettenii (strain ATCC MYA-4622 / CBS 123669 / FGSC 9596 / NRRL 45880 / 77-13-4) TaxID=660122 RepID=C7Z7N3_FUSV7|nr:uncharacterized protein NECHADRAFT_79498 [Fusarium vanettenii 77-13-4]EEU39720.1 predicted protein [Fusarium vanettenii 77-13-4]